MGMGVCIVGAAMCSPASVSDAKRSLPWAGAILDTGKQIGNFAGATAQFECTCRGEYGDAGRVIAAIFELAQAIEQYGSNIGPLRANVAYDTAHEVGYPFFCKVAFLLHVYTEGWRPPVQDLADARFLPAFLPTSLMAFWADRYRSGL